MHNSLIISFLFLFMFSNISGMPLLKRGAGDFQHKPANFLFYLERNRDADKVYYQANTDKNGFLNTKDPIEIFWIKYTQKQQKEPLTRIQEKYSYGIRYQNISKKEATFQFASTPERYFTVKQDNSGEYRVFTQINGKWAVLEKMSVHFSGGTYLMPVLGHIELFFSDPYSGNLSVQKIEP